MPTIVKWPGGYQCRVRLAGHPPQSKVFETKAKAAAWGHAIEANLRDQRAGVVKATLQDAIDKFIKDVCPGLKSGDNYTKRLKALAKIPELLPTLRQIADVTAADLSRFRDKRLAVVALATVRKEMTILRSVFESARRDWGMISVNPINDVKRPPAAPHRDRLFVGTEAQRIVAALGYVDTVKTQSQQCAVALLLAFETAMRSSELLGLTWDRVHLEAQYVSLPETKNGDSREVALSTRAVELLKKLQGLDKVRVFTLEPGTRDALFRRARDACGIKNLHFHDSRANAITMLAKKLDIHDLARMIGHRDLKSLLIYYRKTASDIAKNLG
jgi:integrase